MLNIKECYEILEYFVTIVSTEGKQILIIKMIRLLLVSKKQQNTGDKQVFIKTPLIILL